MDLLAILFGAENHVTVGQICARAILLFLFGLVMLRLSGRRTFAEWTGLDVIIMVMAGSIMGRTVMGSGSLAGALAAVTILVFLHRALAYAVAKNQSVARIVEGEAVTLASDGVLDETMRCRHNVSIAEIVAAMRKQQLIGLQDLGRVKAIVLEPTGDIHVIKLN